MNNATTTKKTQTAAAKTTTRAPKASASRVANANPLNAVIDQREGQFCFLTAQQAADTPVTVVAATPAQGYAIPAAPAAAAPSAKAPAARMARARFDTDEALVAFINMLQWDDRKTQWILDNLRKQGYSCSMARCNRVLGRDSSGKALPAK